MGRGLFSLGESGPGRGRVRSEPALPVDGAVLVDPTEDLWVLGACAGTPEVLERLRGGAEERRHAAGGQEQEAIAEVEALGAVGHDDDDPAAVREGSQELHHVLFVAGVQARGRFVQEHQRRSGQELEGHARPLPLAAGQGLDPETRAIRESEIEDHLIHPLFDRGAGDVGGESEAGSIGKRLPQGELRVEDVLLRDVAHPLPDVVVFAVEIATAVRDAALGGRPETRQRVEEGGLAGPGWPDDRQQRRRSDAEGDVSQDRAAVRDDHRECLRAELDGAPLDVLLQGAGVHPEQVAADADQVALGDEGALDPDAVDERAVVAPQVDELGRAVGETTELGVAPGHAEIVQDEIVVIAAPDPCRRLQEAMDVAQPTEAAPIAAVGGYGRWWRLTGAVGFVPEVERGSIVRRSEEEARV